MTARCQIRFLVLSLLLVCSRPTSGFEGQSLEPAAGLSVPCPSVPGIVASETGFEHIVNPIVFTLAEAADTFEEFERTRDCLVRGSASSNRALTARVYLDLFISFLEPFVGTDSNESLDLVDLATTRDPGIRRLREDVGLLAPDGMIFVRYFSQAEQMPAEVRRAFDNPQAQAVTIGTRYVAVLKPAPRTIAQRNLLDDALEATYSHELIHAFLNARLGAAIFETGFPPWFHEGMAIHFSGSGRAHVAIDYGAGSIFTIEPTVEYEQYERVFRYLESQLGTNDFHAAVRTAVNEANPSALLTEAGFESYEQLQAQAELWWRWRPIPVVFLVAPQLWGFLLFVALGTAVSWRVWRRWQPAVPGSALEVGVNADLFEAVKSADDQAVKYLLRSGAEPNAIDPEGWTVLRWAVFFNRASAVEALMGAGAEPSRGLLVFAESRDTMPEIIRLLADAMGSFDDETL